MSGGAVTGRVAELSAKVRAGIGTSSLRGVVEGEAVGALHELAAIARDAEQRAEKAERLLVGVESILTADEPPDEVFRYFQRLHGLPEVGAPKHPAEATVARLQAELAALRNVYDAASPLTDPTHQLSQLEWNGVMSQLRYAISQYEDAALSAGATDVGAADSEEGRT